MNIIYRIQLCLIIKAAKCIFDALVQLLLGYTDTALGNLGSGASQELERLRNWGARIVLQERSFENTFRNLNSIKLEDRRIMHKCILVYKCVNNFTPEYLQNYFMKKAHKYNTGRKDDVMLPKPKLELFKKSFYYSGPFYFNSRPDDIKNVLSLSSFKEKIFKHFFYYEILIYI